MTQIENIKTEIEKLNASICEVENYLSDAKRNVDQNQQQYETARSVATKASARTHLDEALREFDHHSRHKEEIQEAKNEKNQKLKELQLQEKEQANEPLRNQAEDLAQQLNRKQGEIVTILREMENLQSEFQPTHKHDHLINWQNSNAQLIIDELPYFYWVNDSRKNSHYRIVKLSSREIRS